MPFDPTATAEELPPLTGGFDPSKPATHVDNAGSNDFLTPRGKDIVSKIYTPLLKYGGAAAGAALAAPVAGAEALGTAGVGTPASVATEIGAGAGGYAIGGDLAQKLDQLIGISKPYTGKNMVIETEKNLMEGALQESGGRVTGQAIDGVASILSKTPEAAGALVQKAKNIGIDLSPAEVLGTKSMQVMESVLDHLPWTDNIIQKFRLGQLQQLNKARQALIEKGGSSEDIEGMGLEIKNQADRFMQQFNNVNKTAQGAMKDRLLQKVGSNATYNSLDESAQQAVQTYQADLSKQITAAYTSVADKAPKDAQLPQNTMDVADKILQEQERVAPSLRNHDLIKAAKFFTQSQQTIDPRVIAAYQGSLQATDPTIKNTLEQEYPGLVNGGLSKTYYDLASNVQAMNLKKEAQVTTTHGSYQISNAGRQWDDMIDAAHKDMNTIVSSSGNNDLIQAQEVARNLFLKKMALFDDPAFKAINDKAPGAIATSILQSGNTNLIQRYRALTGEPLFNKAKDRLTNDVLGLGENDVIKGDDIRKNIVNLGEGINSIYSPAEIAYFKKLAAAVDIRSGATKELLNNPLLKKMIGPEATLVPSGIAGTLVTPQNSGNAAAIEQMMGTDAKNKVANAFLPELLSKGQDGNFLPQTFAKQFNQYGRKTLESWYGKEMTDQLKNLAQVSRPMGGAESMKNQGLGLSYLIGFHTAGTLGNAALHVATGNLPSAMMTFGKEGAMFFTSRQLAKLYTTPMGKNLFIQGLTTPIASKAASVIGGRIMGLLGNEIVKNGQQQ